MNTGMLVPVMFTLGALSTHAWSKRQGRQALVPSSVIDLNDAFDQKKPLLGAAVHPDLQGEIEIGRQTYTWGDRLGEGGNGLVHLLKDTSGQQFAGKLVRCADADCRKQVQQEIDLQVQCQGDEHIVKIMGDREFHEQEGAQAGVQDGDTVIVMEYLPDGDLGKMIEESPGGRGLQPDVDIRGMFHQIVRGVRHIHLKHVAHLDLKPLNIFLNGNTVKIGDFGAAAKIGHINKLAGSPHYISPEMIKSARKEGGSYRGDEADVWSLGVMLYKMLTGKDPFSPVMGRRPKEVSMAQWVQRARDQLYDNILHQSPTDLYPNGVTEEAKQLVQKMLQRNIGDRITLDRVLEHAAMQPGHVMKQPDSLEDAATQPGRLGRVTQLPDSLEPASLPPSKTAPALKPTWRSRAKDALVNTRGKVAALRSSARLRLRGAKAAKGQGKQEGSITFHDV